MLKPILLLALLLAAPRPSPAQGVESAGPTASPRALVVILDAVPFSTVERLLEARASSEPLFDGFQPPVPLISSFPSSTSVAMVGLLEPFELPRSPGYEARFFDWDRGRVRGGGAISFFRIDFAWREFFDWSRKGVVRSAWGGLRPVEVSLARIDIAVEAFMAADDSPFFVYLETTDLAAHLKGPEALGQVLVRLDAAITRARLQYPERDFRTVILSDHGVAGDGTRLVNAFPGVRKALQAAGLRRTRRLRRAGDVVLTPFGLVSSFEAYAGDERVEDLATALVGADGVDLCVYDRHDAVWVEGGAGRARVQRLEGADGVSWRYSVETGDPLGYGPIAAELAADGAEDGHASDSRWLEATAGHDYPDALHRMTRAFQLVDNPASVLCSLDEGFMYGRSSTEWLARLSGSTVRWTHGALSRNATLGFLLTDDERFASRGALRFDRALAPLTERRSGDSEVRAGLAAALPEPSQRDKMPKSN